MPNTPKTPIDFQKVRKRRQRAEHMRRLLVLFGVAVVVGLVFLVNSLLVERGVSTWISDITGSFGGTGYPVDVPGGVIRDVKGVGSYLSVLNDTNLSVYNQKGKLTGSYQEMTESTVLHTGRDRLLCFDVGSKKFSVHSRTRTLLRQDTEYAVLTGGMNDRGDFAVVTSSRTAICEITAYNSRLNQVYICYLAENLVTAVSPSPRGGAMAAGWINGSDGVLLSGVNVYSLSNNTGPVATLELPDELILDVRFYEEDRVGVLTDRRYLVMGADGGVKSQYSLEGRTLSAYETEGRQVLLLCENSESRGGELILLDGDCKERATLPVEGRVTDIALASRRAYVLTDTGVAAYNQNLELQQEYELEFATHIAVVGGRVYYLDREEIGVLGQARAPEEEEWADDDDDWDTQSTPPDEASSVREREPASRPEPEEPEEEAPAQDGGADTAGDPADSPPPAADTAGGMPDDGDLDEPAEEGA